MTTRFGGKITRFKSSSKSILFSITASLLTVSCWANVHERAFKAYINHPNRTLTDTVRLLEGRIQFGAPGSWAERNPPGQGHRLSGPRLRRRRRVESHLRSGPEPAGACRFGPLGCGAAEVRGANDDASCVASIIQAYETLRREPLPNLMVRFILFDEEESGLVGSKAYLEDHSADGVFGMFSLELCGIGDTVAVWESKKAERETLAVRTLLRTLKAMKADHVVEGGHPPFRIGPRQVSAGRGSGAGPDHNPQRGQRDSTGLRLPSQITPDGGTGRIGRPFSIGITHPGTRPTRCRRMP